MRIIGGTAAGRILKAPKGFDVRPTPDLVRQAIFNSLGARVVGATVLELFAGTGALSLECLSRGAAGALCIEKSNKHAGFIRQNVAAAGLDTAHFQIRVQDAFVALAQLAAAGEQFDLILADPPYGEKNINRRSTSFAQQLLDDAHLPRVCRSNGLFVLGHTKRDTLSLRTSWPAPAPPRQPIWQEIKMLKHGDTVIKFFQLNTATENSTSKNP
jgi:16S rRNA (guanine966-N2)-methyltransferase